MFENYILRVKISLKSLRVFFHVEFRPMRRTYQHDTQWGFQKLIPLRPDVQRMAPPKNPNQSIPPGYQPSNTIFESSHLSGTAHSVTSYAASSNQPKVTVEHTEISPKVTVEHTEISPKITVKHTESSPKITVKHAKNFTESHQKIENPTTTLKSHPQPP